MFVRASAGKVSANDTINGQPATLGASGNATVEKVGTWPQGFTLDPATGAVKTDDKVQPGDAVFVFARALSGQPMPLAVKRLTVADLPAEVSLSDSDAMMPQLKLSKFPQVQLVARVSRAGNATAGEWIGRSAGVSSQSTEQQSVRISEADQR